MNKMAEITFQLIDGKLIPFSEGVMLPVRKCELIQSGDDLQIMRLELLLVEGVKITSAN